MMSTCIRKTNKNGQSHDKLTFNWDASKGETFLIGKKFDRVIFPCGTRDNTSHGHH